MKQFGKFLQTGKTVWTINDVHMFLGGTDKQYTRLLLHRMKKIGFLVNPTPGIYCLPKYDKREFAAKIKSGSYISCESVLVKYGIIFQSYDTTITLISTNTLEKIIRKTTYRYHKIHNRILTNPTGIDNHENKYLIASPERALCDLIYLTGTTTVDNSEPLNKTKLETLIPLYNKITQKRIYLFIHHAGLQQT